ncbi:membrane-spanning 4-domains subfamily A member 12-like [Acipenser oxyrinchus oxyrinchus]|uniref:Membrane-spanning 4-domains subfamily A member 12-like n=1 Tax=Acipenser oxyrinchus oxyrinchus TaxID=40147 RepID=A0AAD8CPG0_ACIOX|nr:membrane-spanning 4-domains subfamily A member 12-like [Acipenser oxyrinchus oxyrinchus]
MASTYTADDRMIITIPLGKLKDLQRGEKYNPETFSSTFSDSYKLFLNGQLKALGAVQILLGMVHLACCILLYQHAHPIGSVMLTLLSIVFIISGLLTVAAASTPVMCLMMFSFALNIISSLWGAVAFCISIIFAATSFKPPPCCQSIQPTPGSPVMMTIKGIEALIIIFHALELIVSGLTWHFESKALFRDSFNVLPVIYLEQDA